MVIRIIRLTKRDEKIEITVTTNNIAHSVLSDNPELKLEIEEGIQTALTKYLREKEGINETNAH